jgi:hypothetical protein
LGGLGEAASAGVFNLHRVGSHHGGRIAEGRYRTAT